MSSTLKKLFLTTILVFALATVVSADIVYVDDDGDPVTTVPTLQAGIATAEALPGGPHDIVIMEGSYDDYGLVISDPTKIASITGDPSGDKTLIVFQAPTASYQTVSFFDLSGTTDLVINHFTVKDYQFGFDGSGINGLVMTDMVLDNNGMDGFTAHLVDDLGGGVVLKDCDGGLFEDLEIMNGERGLRLKDDLDHSDGNTIKGCLVYDNEEYGIGIGWGGGSNNTIEDNTVYGSEDFGIQIRGAGNGNKILNNTVYDCIWEGITVSGCTNSTITGNTVYGCAYQITNPSGGNDHAGLSYAGIDIEGAATSATVSGNTSYNNGDGLSGFGINVDGSYCNIGYNCFYGHPGTQAVDNIGGNSWHHNYYGDIAVGATSYVVGLCTDWSPKMRSNSAVGAGTMEVWSYQTVTFEWALPDVCDPADEIEFAAYEFTVSWNPALLDYVGGDNDEFFGSEGLYVVDEGTGFVTFGGVNIDEPNLGEGVLAHADFQAIGVGVATISLSSSYRQPDNTPIPVTNNDLVITLTDTEAPVVYSVTPNNPNGDDVYSGYEGLEFDACATDNYALQKIRYQIDGGGYIGVSIAVTGTDDCAATFMVDMATIGEGSHTLNVYAKDMQNLWSASYDYNFSVDKTGPVLTSVILSDADGCALNPEYTNDQTVTVTFVDDGTAEMMEYHNGSWEGPIAYAASPQSYPLVSDGLQRLYFRLYDAYGNVGSYLYDEITVDLAAPVPTDLVLAGGAAKTNTTSITGTAMLDVAGGTVEINYSEDAADLVCGNAGWVAWYKPFAIELSSGDGMKTVYFAVRDLAGNISTILSDDIELDQTAAELASFTVTDATGSECSDNWTVSVTIEWTDADVKYINLTNGDGYTQTDISAETSPFTLSYDITSPTRVCDDLNTVSGYLDDDIGNPSVELSDDVYVDCYVPTITAVDMYDPDYDGIDPTVHENWSNNAEVGLSITGLAADVVEVQVSETGVFAGEESVYAVSSPAPDPFVIMHTYAGPTECDLNTISVRPRDCADRLGAVVTDQITFDLTGPTINSFTVTSEDPTDVLSVNLAIDAVDNCNAWKMNIYEDGHMGDGSGWITDATTYTLALADDGDGVRTINLEFTDPAGNIVSTTTTVEVDQTVPMGTFSLRQPSNTYASPGYTNSLTGIEVFDIVPDADVVEMAIINSDGSNNTSWQPVASTWSGFTLAGGGDGVRTVQMLFKDAAGNYGAWTDNEATIHYLGTAPLPPAPGSATATMGGSVDLAWGEPANAREYLVKFLRTGVYPNYDALLLPPPHPIDTLEGFVAYRGDDPSCSFDGPGYDIYAFSIWTIDFAGNISVTPNIDLVSTDYILGDLDDNGVVELTPDFLQWSIAYGEAVGGDYWDPACDIGPTSSGLGTGYPLVDGVINLEDLMVMGMNYDVYGGSRDNGEIIIIVPPPPAKLVPAKIELIASTTECINPGDEFIVSLTASNVEDIKAYHFVFDYDHENVELVSVESGAIFETVKESFFYYDKNAAGLDVTGMVMGADAAFRGEEMARFIFRSKTGEFRLEGTDLTIRDRQNSDFDITFECAAAKTLPTAFALEQNYPNPFNPATTIKFSLPVASDYRLTIFNITGQVVHSISGQAEVGTVSVLWNASSNSSGVYFYKLEAGAFSETKKMVLLK